QVAARGLHRALRALGPRREGPAHRPAQPWRLRAAQRGGHPGAAARRHAERGERQRHAARPRHGPRLPTAAAARPGERQAEQGGVEVNPADYLYLSAILFTLGALGVLVRRNAIVVFMCIELMLNAANLAFVTFARMRGAL